MSLPADIVRRRRKRSQREASGRTAKSGRVGLLIAVLLSLLLALTAVGGAVFYGDLSRDLPSHQALPIWLDPDNGMLLQPNVILDRSGSQVIATLDNPAVGERTYRRYNDFPAALLDAVVAASDPDFWQHGGYQLNDNESPTLAEQLIANLLLWQEPEGLRKTWRIRLLAAQVTEFYGREQVLEWYLNTADFGQRAQGADAAARLYFGTPVTELSVAEAASLAAIARAPDLNPIDTPELAFDQRQVVIELMFSAGMLNVTAAEAALREPFELTEHRANQPAPDSAFIAQVISDLNRLIPPERLTAGGLQIISTLDADLQSQALCAMKVQLNRMNRDSLASSSAAACEAARLLPTLTLAEDSAAIQAGGDIVILDPHSSQILALVSLDSSGRGAPGLTAHPPGSILAPYVYLSAFTRGFSPASLVWDIPAELPFGLTASPNLSGEFEGPMRMRIALASEFLGPTLALLAQLGPENVWQTAGQLGLPSLNIPAGEPAQRLLLSGGALSLLELSQAYSAFNNQGVLLGYTQGTSPVSAAAAPLNAISVLRVVDINGKVWAELPPPQARPLVSPQLAYLITHSLSDESARWPGFGHPSALEIGRPAAVKTGFTQDLQQAWTIGFTPDLLIGVRLGQDPDLEGTGQVIPDMAAGLWHALIKQAGANSGAINWDVPPGLSFIDVCDPSGMLPTPECPSVVKELFVPGSEPTQADILYRRIQINRETGLLATIFTPPGLIDDRVFLVPPPAALNWAHNAGLAIPPDAYDLVSEPVGRSPFARLDTPGMFASVAGQVVIAGTASGDGFTSYRIQVGQGLNPQQWIQVGDESSTPIESGTLVEWDTAGLSGLYVVRLVVLYEDQQIISDVIQVTLDNQAPQTSILYPAVDQRFTYPTDQSMTIQIAASDDLVLASVAIYVDDQLLATLADPPFAVVWQIVPGEHTLRVVVSDLTGNITELSQVFFVDR
jgi:membrane carboxypeptidase/penicillin-binding protein